MTSESEPRRDPLDVGEQKTKAWEEFAVQFSGARLLSLLLSEIDAVTPDFFDDLKDRFYNAYAESDSLADESDDWDRDWVTIDTPAYQYWTDRAGARELYYQLFPHTDKDIAMEHVGRGLALVGFHSAIEHYLAVVSGNPSRGGLVDQIQAYISRVGKGLEPSEYQALVTLDETRHLIVHHRSVVNDRYVANVPYAKVLSGERRDVSNAELWRMGDLVWQLAFRIRDVSSADSQ